MKALLSLTTVALLSALVTLSGCGDSSQVVSSSSGSSSNPGGSVTDAGGSVVKVVSNRADLVNGDDVLIDIVPPAGTDSGEIAVTLNDGDVTGQFSPTAQGTLRGLVTGLARGENIIAAHYPDGHASVTVTNHPNGGPVLAGPQLQPWTCQPGAVDAQCNQAPVFVYFYKAATNSDFKPYDPANPPPHVVNTTTDQGVTVPFIVRVETGYQDRDQYQIAVLFQPGQPWSAEQPQPQFNHKLLVTHGVSCGIEYQTGTAPDVTDSNGLGAGFAVMSTALDYSGHNCNVALQAESLIMAKEHLIEHYGTLRYTIGAGCSGGSLAIQWISNAYPGIYQGILPTCSFPDAWSIATQFADYHLLLAYFGNPSQWGDGISWSEQAKAKVEGHHSTQNAMVSESAQWHVSVPTDPCPGTTAEQRYDPDTNPGGVRCDIQDAAINLFGPRPPALWTDMEKAVGHGFAGFAVDNVGVEYGLAALQQGAITLAQFLDVNEKIGGLDVDTNRIPQRTAAVEPALSNAYRTGLINEATNLDETAIIDCRGPDPGLFHDAYRAFALRGRLDRAHGSHANQLIWEGPLVIEADPDCARNSFFAMDRWLAAVEQDDSGLSLAQKIAADKPADLGDECWDGAGVKVHDGLCGETVVPLYGTPRTVAGDAITVDTNKCQLKPLNRSDDYGSTPFTDAQWSQMEALFRDGICDFSKPGVSQQATIPWQTYQDGNGSVIYGGTALPPAPAGSGSGWSAPAFRNSASGVASGAS